VRLVGVAVFAALTAGSGAAFVSPVEGPVGLRAERRPAPTFEVDVANVNVDVFVSRGDGTIEGLTAADFELRDNGVRQRLELVERRATAVDAVLVLDVSTSVRGKALDALRNAAHRFVDALSEADFVTVLAFGTDLRLVARAGAPRTEVHAAIDALQGAGATSLVDAVHAGLLLTEPRRGRPLVVVFTDGVDRGSWLTEEDVLATAKLEDVVVHYVEVGGASSFLAALADATGGRRWSASRWDRLPHAFLEALDEFRSRYRLRYEPTGVAGRGWHSLEVRLAKARRGRVRARPGYLVPGGADGR
jgi:VWFA-related protein